MGAKDMAGSRGGGSAWGLALCAVAVSVAGCTDNPIRMSMPSGNDVVAPFPANQEVSAEPVKATPVEVTLSEPTGTIQTLRAINVSFNQPMEAGSGQGPSPLQISPAIKGELRWLGDRTISFVPSQALPMATRFEVVVPKGLRGFNGQALGSDHRFSFSTPGLEVRRFDPSWYNARLRPDEQIFIQFNLPVALSELESSLQMTQGSAPVKAIISPTLVDRGGDKVAEGTAFMVRPAGGFATGAAYGVTIQGTLKPVNGALTLSGQWVRSFATYGPFAALSARCGWSECTPDATWSVEFSNPVTAEKIARCVTVKPPIAMGEPYGYSGSGHVTFRPRDPKPGTTYELSFSRKCTDDLGNALSEPFVGKIAVGHHLPDITMDRGLQFLEKPTQGEKLQFPITLINTPDVRLRMATLSEAQLPAFLSTYSGWSSGDELKRGVLKAVVDRPFGVKLTTDVKKTYGIALSEALGDKQAGVVYVDVRSDAYDKRYSYNGENYHKSVLQVTDIGLTAKYSPESVLVWTTSLSKAEPLDGVRVALRGPDGELLWEGKTDKEGLAVGPGLKTFGGKRPRVLLATRGDELSFLDLNDWNTQIEPYRFNQPYDWDAPAVALRGHVFTERGVYRPGETVYIKGYLRMDRGRKLELLPVDRARVRVKDAQNNLVVDEEVEMTDLDGFSAEVSVGKDAPLGTWSIEAVPVGIDGDAQGQGSGSFRVEAYRAPDFEVVVSAAQSDVIVGEKAAVSISGQYLFGAPMGGAKARWLARRQETSFAPVGFEQYAFGDNTYDNWWNEDSSGSSHLGEGEEDLNGAGMVERSLEIMPDAVLKGPQELIVEASVSDINRQVVSGSARVKIHPGEFYVGLKRPGYLVEAGKPQSFGVVAVGVKGEAQAGRRVSVELVKRTWTSVRKSMTGGGSTWVTENEDKLVTSCAVNTATTARSCDLTIQDPGYYVLKGSSSDDKNRAVETSTSFYVWGGGWSWWGSSDDERIDLIADKQRYKVGEKARIMVKSPFRESRALVTVERRGVLEQRAVLLRGSASTIEVPVTEDMLPNAYVAVTLIRGREDKPKDDDGTTIDPGKPAFKMGYVALEVDRTEKVLSVSVEPERRVYRPGETVNAEILVKDSAGNPVSGEVTFMAVDEGVLSLTGYKTPNPIADFYMKASLGVITAESRMAIVSRVDGASEEDGEKGDEGGGGEGGGEAANYRAAFATTAAFIPTVVTDASGKAKVSFKLPDNLTAFRLMAVGAGSDNRFGSGDTRVQVQKPLMLRPSLPRVASTGDTFEVRAVVQAVGESAGRVRVSAEVKGPVELTGAQSAEIDLGRGQAREVVFPAVVGAPGEAIFRFKAVALDGFVAEDAVELKLPVRFPAVTRTQIETGAVMARGEGIDRVWKRLSLPEEIRSDVGGLDIELASTAMADLLPGLDYLVSYPYGCVEQTTGSTLPLVAMRGLMGDVELPGIKEGDVVKFAQAGLDRLFSMQTYDGGLGYWPGDDTSHPWGSAYGGLARVMAARTEGLKVDAAKLDLLMGYLREVLRDEVATESWWRAEALDNTRAFAAYVLAEADEAEPAYHSTLFESRGRLGSFGKGLLAMAIMRSGGDERMSRVLLADMLEGAQINGAEATLAVDESREYYWEIMDSDVRSNSVALMALMMARPDDALVTKFSRGLLAARRGGRWLSTQENAFAVVSLMRFFHETEKETPAFVAHIGLGEEVVMSTRFKERGLKPRKLHIPMSDLLKHHGEVISIVREGSAGPLYYTMKLSFAPTKPPTEAFDNGFTIKREVLGASGPDADKPVKSVKPGEMVKVRLTIVAPEERHYVAINAPLPAGLEPVNTSFATVAPSLSEAMDQENADLDGWDDWWYGQHDFDRIEQRDDRVVLFADYLPAGVITHTTLARATTLGRFTVPAAFAEEMYDPSVYGRTEAFTFEIK